MKHILISGLLFSLLTISCANENNKPKKENENLQINVDTLIGNKKITNKIAGSAFRKKAISYFIVIKRDTSDYQPIFTESKEGSKVGVDIRYEKRTLTYRQRMSEFKTVLCSAAKDFNLDSLRSIFLGRLVLSGDLAIDITNQYRQKFGQNNQISNHEKVSQFLLESKLTTDLNDLLKPYSISVDKIYPEHIFFTSKQDLYLSSKIESDSLSVPDKIFDCMIWIGLKKTN